METTLRKICRAFATSAFCLLLNISAHAQTRGTPERAEAQSFFDQGRSLMAEGAFEKACRAFQASQKLDPAGGTLLNLASCFEKMGLIASAWSTYAEVEDLEGRAGDQERARVAAQERKRLGRLLTRLVIHVEGLSPDTIVTLDERLLASETLELARPVDPGAHTLVISEKNKAKFVHRFEVDADTALESPLVVRLGPLQLIAPPLEPVNTEADSAERVSAVAPTQRAERLETVPSRARVIRPARLGWGIGLGVAGLGATTWSAVYLASAYSLASEADCDANDNCSPAGLSDRKSAQTRQAIAFGVMAGGVIAVAVGVTLSVSAFRSPTAVGSVALAATKDGGARVAFTLKL